MYELLINEKNEILMAPLSNRKQEIPLLGIVGEYTKVFRSMYKANEDMFPPNIYLVLPSFLSSRNEILHNDPYVPTLLIEKIDQDAESNVDLFMTTARWHWLEYLALESAVNDWLTPENKTDKPSELFIKNRVQVSKNITEEVYQSLDQYIKGELTLESVVKLYREEILRARIQEVSAHLDVTDGKLTWLYIGKRYLSLAWAEIMWAIEHEKFARLCVNCGRSFVLGVQRSKLTCSKQCAADWKKTRMGGEEELREYNRVKKKESRERDKDKRRATNGRMG